MRLDVFLLSDAASVAEGKLYVHGGGISRINAITMPISVQLALTVRIGLDENELSETHRLVLSVTDPDGAFVMPPATINVGGGELEPADLEHLADGEEIYLLFTIGLGLTFGRVGTYHFALKSDDATLRDMSLPVVPLTAEQLEGLQPMPMPPSSPSPPSRSPQPGQPNRAERRRQQRR